LIYMRIWDIKIDREKSINLRTSAKIKKDFFNLEYKTMQDIIVKKKLIKENKKIFIRIKKLKLLKQIKFFLFVSLPIFLVIFFVLTISVLHKLYYWKEGIISEIKNGQNEIVEMKNFKNEAISRFKNGLFPAEDSIGNAKKQLDFLLDKLAKSKTEKSIFYMLEKLVSSGDNLEKARVTTIDIMYEIYDRLPYSFDVKDKGDNFFTIIDTLNSEEKKIKSICLDIKKSREDFDIGYEKLQKRKEVDFANIGIKLHKLEESVCFFSDNLENIKKLLGSERTMKYLILLQNSSEQRSSGGFVGSYLVLDIFESKIKNIKFKDVYELDNNFYSEIKSPIGLDKLAPNLKMRDANIYSDFRQTGRDMAKFYEKQGGETVDVVIAIDDKMLEKLLKNFGNIEIQDNVFLTHENYKILLSFFIEKKIAGEKQPKIIIDNMINKIIQDLDYKNSKEAIFPLLVDIRKLAQEKHIFAFAYEKKLQNFFSDLDIAGELHDIGENEDFITISHTNIVGNKSDKYMEEKILKETKINLSGKVENKVTIYRKHKFDGEERKKIFEILENAGIEKEAIDETVLEILGKGTNIHRIKILVPLGAEFKKISGINKKTFKQGTERAKKYFSFEMQVKAGKEEKVVIEYEIDNLFDIDKIASFETFFEKSPGMDYQKFYEKFFINENFEIFRVGKGMAKRRKNFVSFGGKVRKSTSNKILLLRKEKKLSVEKKIKKVFEDFL